MTQEGEREVECALKWGGVEGHSSSAEIASTQCEIFACIMLGVIPGCNGYNGYGRTLQENLGNQGGNSGRILSRVSLFPSGEFFARSPRRGQSCCASTHIASSSCAGVAALPGVVTANPLGWLALARCGVLQPFCGVVRYVSM